MAKMPQAGDPVIHHGHPHTISYFETTAAMRDGKPVAISIAVFENDRFLAACRADELVWSDSDAAWYLPGRVLSRNERAVCQAVTGSWPPAENHIAMRAMLDTVDLDTLDRGRLKTVLLQRKADLRERVDAADAAGADREAVIQDYIDAVIAQVAALRKNRGV